MPRVTELVGYHIGITDADIPITDTNGQTVTNGNGQPQTTPGKQLVFFDQFGDTVKVTLGDAARQALIGLLTGGIAIATDLPPPG
jgi:hypothetical protein